MQCSPTHDVSISKGQFFTKFHLPLENLIQGYKNRLATKVLDLPLPGFLDQVRRYDKSDGGLGVNM
jgi:hypothetical protein